MLHREDDVDDVVSIVHTLYHLIVGVFDIVAAIAGKVGPVSLSARPMPSEY